MNITKQEILDLLSKIQIVKVLSFKKNENSDHLLVVHVDVGSGEKQIVTGANNFKEGDFVPYLGVGETVPGFLFKSGERIVLEPKKLRGYESAGMILAEDEIGLSNDHEGILIINDQDFQINLKENPTGRSFLSVLTDEHIQKIMKYAGVIEITPELQSRIDLIKSIAFDGGEIIGEDELPGILTSGEELFTYDGFEPSGQMHIAQGIIRAINTNKMIKAGFTFRMWVADWFGYLNNKMGGDLEKIKKVGEYFIEIWKASGMNLEGTEFLWTSDFVGQREYWETVMKVSKAATLKRMLRTTEIMGRSETDDLSAAQILYPAMQITDIFHVMKCQVTQLGLDQKKVNVLAREIGPELGFWKPVIVSQGMLQGLQTPVEAKSLHIKLRSHNLIPSYGLYSEGSITVVFQKEDHVGLTLDMVNHESNEVRNVFLKRDEKVKFFGITLEFQYDEQNPILKITGNDSERLISMKMSKSKPDTAIFMTDTRADIERKIKNAYCPPKEIADNPIIAYVKQIIFEAHHLKGFENFLKDGFFVSRPAQYGGDVTYKTFEEVVEAYQKDELSPVDLKAAVVEYLDQLLQPVRNHFENNLEAKQLLAEIQSFQVTR